MTAPLVICSGSHSASFTTGGVSDSRGICGSCGQRITIRPAGRGSRWTRRDLPVLEWHEVAS